MAAVEYSICGLCGTSSATATACPACGANALFRVVNGYVLEFPPHTIPCPRCGGTDGPVRFRGWAHLVALVFWARERRLGAYLCGECGRRETIKALVLTSLLGWWSFPSWFFYGWRATYLNWRAVFAPPARPHEWGALSAHQFAAILGDTREASTADAEEEWLLTETPLRHLSATQIDLVLGAEDLYAQLGEAPEASTERLRHAYRARCKEIHPDLHDGSRGATEEMMRLNQAWEILRSPAMREAYDWVQGQRDQTPA